MPQALDVYIPADRRRAIAAGTELPDRTEGAALFVDISGFMALTDILASALGPRAGAEELARQLNRVYDAVIAEVDWHGGSVLGFSGDGITCWFDDAEGPGAARATASALAMQQAMGAFTRLSLPGGQTAVLAMKAGIATGPVRRFLVGDPQIQLLDVVAGATVVRMAAAAGLARPGELVVDGATASRVGEALEVHEWRADDRSGEGMAVVRALARSAAPGLSFGSSPALLEAASRPWLLPAIRDRLQQGLDQALMELRPVVVFFCQFEGIDYDGDVGARAELEGYVRRAQRVLAAYGGSLLQLAVDDKGSHFYAAFGAPTAHEDDARRAVSAARELREPAAGPSEEPGRVAPPRIGISRGMMHAGAYGGRTRRTYGVLGEEVNVAARLMEAAAAGEVLVSERVWRAARGFSWEPLLPIELKGRREPLPAARLTEGPVWSAPLDAAPMVGRDPELFRLVGILEPIFEGRFAGLVYVHGEAGMGKTRLALSLREQLCGARGARWFTCPTDGLRQRSLYPFQRFLLEHSGLGAAGSGAVGQPAEKISAAIDRLVDGLLGDMPEPGSREDEEGQRVARGLERARPFLAALAGASIAGADTEIARLGPKLLFENELDAFKSLVVAECRRQPVVLHVEDAQWLDEDSEALLQRLVRNVADVPLAILLTSRYRDDGTPVVVPVDENVPQATIDLGQLSDTEVRHLAGTLLGGEIGHELGEFLLEKTGGNPFFVEQLALDLRERRALRGEGATWELARTGPAELPADLHTVLIARLDRLAAQVKEVVQTAAVLGREFEVQVLSAVLRDESLPGKVAEAEAERVWVALSGLRYLFRHALLRDAAYSMQVETRLRELHALAAAAIETVHAQEFEAHAADLAFHHGRAGNAERERHYAIVAGKAAAARFANADAVLYLSRALALTPAEAAADRFDLLRARQEVHALQSAWREQATDLDALEVLADRLDDDRRRAVVAGERARHANHVSEHAGALAAARRAIALARAAGDVESELVGYLQAGSAFRFLGEYAEARAHLERGLALARSAGLSAREAWLLASLGVVFDLSGDRDAAEACFEEDLRLSRELADRPREAAALMHLGVVRWRRGDYPRARDWFERALQLSREVGDRQLECHALGNLGMLARNLADHTAARSYVEESLRLSRELGDRYAECRVGATLGTLALERGDYEAARDTYEKALATSRAIGDRQNETVVLSFLGKLALDTGRADAAETSYREALRLAREIGDRDAEIVALCGLARVADRDQDLSAAAKTYREALASAGHIGNRLETAAAQLALGYTLAHADRPSEAEDAFRSALDLGAALDDPVQIAEARAGLASVLLLRGEAKVALELIEPLLTGTGDGIPHGREEPFAPDLICVRVLRANDDPRWRAVLEAAHLRLVEWASSLSSEDARRAFLESVPAHRALEVEWEHARDARAGGSSPPPETLDR